MSISLIVALRNLKKAASYSGPHWVQDSVSEPQRVVLVTALANQLALLMILAALIYGLFLRIPAAQAAKVTLGWNPSSGPVAGYIVYYRKGDTADALMRPLTSKLITTTTYTTPDLAAGKYAFRVRAFDRFWNSSGDSNEVQATIADPTVAALTADFSANRLGGIAPLAIDFTEQAAGVITRWLWDFGDNTTSTAQNPSKTYAKPGTYTVSLTATGPSGRQTLTKAGYIAVAPPTASALASVALPSARFSTATLSDGSPLVVVFTDTSTGHVASRHWEFGDGTVSTSPNYVKTYTKPGTYTAKLTVSNARGSTSASKTLTAIAVNPVADFTVNLKSGSAPLTAAFTATSTGTIEHYFWSFGDGGTSHDPSPAHTYTKPGRYDVHLTTIGPSGISTKTEKAYIHVGETGLVAAYSFEEHHGNHAVIDGSGNGHHGTAHGANQTKGKFGNALAFDGVNDWVTLPELGLLERSGALTLEAWVYPKSQVGCQPLFVKQGTLIQDEPKCGYGFSLGEYSGMGYSRMTHDSTTAVAAAEIQPATTPLLPYAKLDLSTGRWQHLAFVYENGADGVPKVTLYINGAAKRWYSVEQPIPQGQKPFDLGRFYKDSGYRQYFNGLIDEVRIYNRALTEREINTHLTSSAP